MVSIERRIQIAAAPAEVFRFCQNQDRRSEWDTRAGRVKVLTPKPIRRGTLIRVDAHPSVGPVFSWEGEFVEFHFPTAFRIEVVDAAASSYFVAGSETWQFRAISGGTNISYQWDYRPRGIWGWVLDLGFRRWSVRRNVAESFERLRQTIEEHRSV